MKQKSEYRIPAPKDSGLNIETINFRYLSLIILFCVILISFCQADLIYLQNGKTIEGEITETTPGVYLIKGKGGSFSVTKSMILKIVRWDESGTETTVNLMIEVGAVVKKDDADKLQQAIIALGFSSTQIIDDPPYYKIRVGPFRKETDAVAVAEKIDTAKLPSVYPTGSRVFRLDSSGLGTVGSSTAVTETNIALPINGATVIADSQLPGYPAGNAVDGYWLELTSRWISDSATGPHWLEINFGKPRPFNRIELYTGEAHSFDYILRDFALQYWSGSEWKDIPGAQKKNNLIENPQFTFIEQTAQKVRLYVTKGSNLDNLARVYELRIFNKEQLDTENQFNRTIITERNYLISLVGPKKMLNENPTVTVATTQWYTLFCSVSYTAQSTTVLAGRIDPDATDFWVSAELRRELEISTEEYNTTINFDTQRTPGYANVLGTGTISFGLKSKSPACLGKYPKKLRISLLNPENRSSFVFQEIPFTLLVE